MKPRIPPQKAWPLFIVLLFVTGAVATLSMVWIAASDGGAQVIDNYYEKAVNWDDTASRRGESEALGWTSDVDIQGTSDDQSMIVIAVEDRSGAPVTGLSGTVRLYRPEVAAALAEVDLVEKPQRSGEYRLEMPFGRRGIWDVEIEATRDSALYWDRIRTELR